MTSFTRTQRKYVQKAYRVMTALGRPVSSRIGT